MQESLYKYEMQHTNFFENNINMVQNIQLNN